MRVKLNLKMQYVLVLVVADLPIYVTDLRVGRLFMNRPMTETFRERETDRKSDRESERERIK